METEALVFVGVCDLSGHFRGKGFPAADLPSRLRKGVGYTGSNIMQSAFGTIYASPFGTEGDLVLRPDPATGVDVACDGFAAERFYLADICSTEGRPWSCCPRDFLRRGLEALRREGGAVIRGAFEQEFTFAGEEGYAGTAYGHDAFRRRARFGEALMAAMRRASVVPDSFLAEYGPAQYEVTYAPAEGVRIADEAVITRELVRAVAFWFGERVSLSPVPNLERVGNGTHVHFSLWDPAGAPLMYDPSSPYGLSALGSAFVAGVAHHLASITAFTASSVVSYYRLRPDRWAPTWNDVGYRDRGASIRIAPIFATAGEDAPAQSNVEFRVTDAAASPYMALGALVHAGVDGIRRGLALRVPKPGTFWKMSEAERRAAGYEPLPSSLGEAIERLKASEAARTWLGPELLDVYAELKTCEVQALRDESAETICARYATAY